MTDVAAVVLAAGRATRFGAENGDSKVFAPLEGRPLVAHVVATALASGVRPVIVVTGAGAARAADMLSGFAPVVFAHNPDFSAGIAGSIRTGLEAVPVEADAAVVFLADMPRVTVGTVRALIDAFAEDGGEAVVPSHGGRWGNPVLVARAMFPALMRLTGDGGARRLLAGGEYRVTIRVVDDPGILVDVDTRDELQALSSDRGEGRRPDV